MIRRMMGQRTMVGWMRMGERMNGGGLASIMFFFSAQLMVEVLLCVVGWIGVCVGGAGHRFFLPFSSSTHDV